MKAVEHRLCFPFHVVDAQDQLTGRKLELPSDPGARVAVRSADEQPRASAITARCVWAAAEVGRFRRLGPDLLQPCRLLVSVFNATGARGERSQPGAETSADKAAGLAYKAPL